MKPRDALVLASSRGVGAAIASELRAAGLTVPTISSRDVDTADADSVERFIRTHPSTDVLVFNTGGPPKKAFEEITSDDFAKYHQQLFLSFASILKGITVRDGGYIFLVSSHLISDPSEQMILSCSYRVASWAMLKALTKPLARRQVSCLNLALGPILTDRLRALTPDLAALEDRLPLKRAGNPQEVGAFVRSIVERDVKYLTGQSITLDGGLSNALF
jgi:3-oxoacyl-[acyl-carrier protein] reductase